MPTPPGFKTIDRPTGFGSAIDYGVVGGSTNVGGDGLNWQLSGAGQTSAQTNPTYGWHLSRVSFPLIYSGSTSQTPRKLSAITDGLSSTVFVVESSGRSETLCTLKSCKWSGGNWDSGAWGSPYNIVPPTGTGFDGVQINSTGPCTMNCTNGPSDNANNIYSWHTGGSNVLFGDGSVHFVSEQIPWTVLGRILTSGNGEVVDGGGYY
jgi:prepilin-type processing-associated H-X9-DG protein